VAPPGATGVASAATLAVPSGSMLRAIANLEAAHPGRRTDALHHAAVEDALYAAAVTTGLVADDSARQRWATIRSSPALACTHQQKHATANDNTVR
jgi:hypothetical protein